MSTFFNDIDEIRGPLMVIAVLHFPVELEALVNNMDLFFSRDTMQWRQGRMELQRMQDSFTMLDLLTSEASEILIRKL